jgi:hypothetical protein
VRVTTKRVGNRLGELEHALMDVRDALESKRYKLGFKGLARLQRKARERERWHARQKYLKLKKG